MTFQPGDIVACVDDKNPGNKGRMPVEGHRYTVRGLNISPKRPTGVLLVEISSGFFYVDGTEVAYKPDRFRKITGPCELQRVEQMRRETVGA